MKKIFAAFLALFVFITPVTPYAQVIGHIYKTDIKAYENYMQIPSYNCGGTTVVFARDLENYGYDVLWDEESMTVEIIKNNKLTLTPIIPSLQGDEPVGTVLFDIYHTDIKTFFEGKLIPAYNIGGKIAIEFRSLGNGKNVKFDEKSRRAHLFTKNVSLSDEELSHIDYIYQIFEATEVIEANLGAVEESAKNGKYGTSAIAELKKSAASLEKITENLKDYSEPAIFSESTMEMWWAIVNLNMATDLLASSQKVLSGEKADLYARYIADYLEQKQNTLNIMASEF